VLGLLQDGYLLVNWDSILDHDRVDLIKGKRLVQSLEALARMNSIRSNESVGFGSIIALLGISGAQMQ